MRSHLIAFALYEVGLSLSFGLFSVLVSLFALRKTVLWEGWTRNTAASVLVASTLISVLTLVQGSVLPAVDTLRAMALAGPLTTTQVALSLGYFLLFYVISLGIAIATIGLTTRIYTAATTRVDELAEIRQGNLGVAIVLGAVIIGMTLFLRGPVQRLNGSLIDYDGITRARTIITPPEIEEIEVTRP